MAKKNKTNNSFIIFLVVVFIIATATFAWLNRYELFPQIIKNGVEVHFLTKNGDDKIVKYNYDKSYGKSKFNFAITKLIQGPSKLQKIFNTYSEIPVGTKILAIIEENDKNIIDLNTTFNTGGGTESIYNKLNQIINTVINNTDKPTYLFINGKQTEVFGGEGIMISQPLSKESL